MALSHLVASASLVSEPAYSEAGPWASKAKWSSAPFNIINYICGFPAILCPNVCWERGLLAEPRQKLVIDMSYQWLYENHCLLNIAYCYFTWMSELHCAEWRMCRVSLQKAVFTFTCSRGKFLCADVKSEFKTRRYEAWLCDITTSLETNCGLICNFPHQHKCDVETWKLPGHMHWEWTFQWSKCLAPTS